MPHSRVRRSRSRHDARNTDLTREDASAAYITDTTTRLPAQLSTTIETLSTALTNASLNSQNLLLASAKADKALLAPLSDEVLIVTDPTTNTKVKVTLGARMEAFTQLVNTEQKRLRALWRKWHEISTNINDTTIGDADDNIKARPAGVATDADGTSNNATASKSYAARHRQLEEEHKKKRQDILDRFEHDCNVLTKGVEDSEKVCSHLARNLLPLLLTLNTEVPSSAEEPAKAVLGLHAGADERRGLRCGDVERCAQHWRIWRSIYMKLVRTKLWIK